MSPLLELLKPFRGRKGKLEVVAVVGDGSPEPYDDDATDDGPKVETTPALDTPQSTVAETTPPPPSDPAPSPQPAPEPAPAATPEPVMDRRRRQ